MLSLALLALGIATLVAGGHFLVRGGSEVARRLGVSPLLVGLTVIAFGTSAPELAVNLAGSLSGRGDVSFGNVVGSNLANLGLILGVAALVRPLRIRSQLIAREIPLMLLGTVAFLVLALDGPLRGEAPRFDRSDGIVLVLFFTVFLYTTARTMLRQRASDALLIQTEERAQGPDLPPVGRSVSFVTLGLAGLIAGGELTVRNAAGFGLLIGLPPALVAFTVVAVGTSLPELVTSVIAARRGETEMAVGNVIGSNLFNVLFIMGTTSVIRPVPVPSGGITDILALVAASLLLFPLSLSDHGRIVRAEGAVLVLLWVLYTAWRLTLGA